MSRFAGLKVKKHKDMKKGIYITNHARVKMDERAISVEMVEEVINNPDSSHKDKIDDSVLHLIKKVGTKFLRVLVRVDENGKQIIITVFFDRRIKRS